MLANTIFEIINFSIARHVEEKMATEDRFSNSESFIVILGRMGMKRVGYARSENAYALSSINAVNTLPINVNYSLRGNVNRVQYNYL